MLAKTLSTADLKVSPEDLIADPIALSKKVIEALHTLQRDMVKGIAHFTDSNGEFKIVQCAKGDYAGTYRGIAGLNEAVGKFFEAQSFVEGQDYESNYQYYGDAKEVVAWGTSTIRVTETGELLDINVTLRFFFEKGKLHRIEDRSDVMVDDKAPDLQKSS